MEASEIGAIVKSEFKEVETLLKTHISEEIAAKYGESTRTLGDVQTKLNQLMERGEAPTAADVKELERKLTEQEGLIREMSLKAVSLAAAGGGAAQADVRDAELFKGSFFPDAEKVRQVFRNMRNISDGEGQKRAIDSGLLTTGGKLSAETADRFIDFLIDKTTALKLCETRRMMSPQGHTDELSVSRRKIRKAVDGVAPETADGMGTKRRTMNTVEIIWAEDVTLTFLEDNIERRGAETHIARLLAGQFGNDMNDLAWNGQTAEDSSGGNAFEAINQGWIALALLDADVTANAVNAALLTTPSNTDILNRTFRNLPVEFKGIPNLGYFVPIPFAERYAEEVSTRETALGDQVLVNGFPSLRYFGHPVIPEPHLYEDNEARLMLTPLSNLYHGIQRQIMIDSEWRPRKRAIEFTITARNDYEYSTGKAIVLVSNIPAANR
jgi:hypothetical protein